MVDLHSIIKKEISEVIRKFDQEHIETQLENLFQNILTNNYDKQDIINLIENYKISETEGSDSE